VRLENNQTFVIGDHVASSKGVNRWSWSLSAAKFAGVAGHYEIRIKANGKSNEAKSGTITLLPKEE